jgi:cytochrome c oxidase subunit 2
MKNSRLARFSGFVVAAIVGVVFFWYVAGEADRVPLGFSEDWQWNLQRPGSEVQEQIYDFHNLLLGLSIAISGFVVGLLVYVMVRFSARNNPTPTRTAHNTLIEVIWTVVPVLILLVIAVPSFRLLYLIDRAVEPELTLIAHGYQWYWGYEYPDQQISEYASYLVPDEEIGEGQIRLLSTDAPVVLPVDTDIQILATAGDVLHAFAVPSLGLKEDAVPGRMNEMWVRIDEPGTYYGQCSELCGLGHGYMPIEVRAVSREAFDDWVVEQVAGRELETPPVLLTRSWQDAMAARQLAANEAR